MLWRSGGQAIGAVLPTCFFAQAECLPCADHGPSLTPRVFCAVKSHGLTYHVMTPPARTQRCRPLHVGPENQVVLSAVKVLRVVCVNLI